MLKNVAKNEDNILQLSEDALAFIELGNINSAKLSLRPMILQTLKFFIKDSAKSKMFTETIKKHLQENNFKNVIQHCISQYRDHKAPETPLLHIPIYYNTPRTLKMLLVDFEESVKCLDKNQCNPLHIAALKNTKEIAQLLIEHGADKDAFDNLEQTPLYMCAGMNHIETAQVLLRSGASVNLENTSRRVTPLHIAASKNHEAFANLLLFHNANQHTVDIDGNTPLHVAAVHHSKNIVELFLANPTAAPIEARNVIGQTPLHAASYKNSVDCVSLLYLNLAKIETVDKHGKTPLQTALEALAIGAAKLLFDLGASTCTKNDKGESTLEIAERTRTLLADLSFLPDINCYAKKVDMIIFGARAATKCSLTAAVQEISSIPDNTELHFKDLPEDFHTPFFTPSAIAAMAGSTTWNSPKTKATLHEAQRQKPK